MSATFYVLVSDAAAARLAELVRLGLWGDNEGAVAEQLILDQLKALTAQGVVGAPEIIPKPAPPVIVDYHGNPPAPRPGKNPADPKGECWTCQDGDSLATYPCPDCGRKDWEIPF